MSVEGFNLLRRRIKGSSGPYQVIIDDVDMVDMFTFSDQLRLIADLLDKGQLDKAIVLMPPGMHLARVR